MPSRSRLVDDLVCNDCGSTVTASDRFCPACGTPNARTKFHPKFGPELVRFEPRILEDVAERGAPSCPRCHRTIEQHDYCGACGMDIGAAWERYERVHTLQAWRDDNRWTRPSYQPTRGLAVTIQVILYLGIATATTIGLLDTWLLARAAGRLVTGPSSATLLQLRDSAELAAAALVVIGGIVLVVWMRLAYANLPALAVGELRFSSGWVVWGWLVPFVNLIRPKQVMDDLWRASDAEVMPFSARWRSAPKSFWCGLWWWGLLLGAAVGLAGHDLIASNAARAVSDPTDVEVGLFVSGAAAFLLAVAALALVVLLQQIVDRQDERAELIATETAETYAAEVEADLIAARTSGSMAPAFGAPEASVLVHQDDESLFGRY